MGNKNGYTGDLNELRAAESGDLHRHEFTNVSRKELQIGDVVRLKSGSPKMTVTAKTNEGGRIECTWFVGETLVVGFPHKDSVEIVDQETGV